MGWVVNATPRPLCPLQREPVPNVQQAGWAPGPIWICAENLVPTDFISETKQKLGLQIGTGELSWYLNDYFLIAGY
jgi:hypothetical protein